MTEPQIFGPRLGSDAICLRADLTMGSALGNLRAALVSGASMLAMRADNCAEDDPAKHGRGFAVVAGEVRALAQRSASAAREIKTLIGTSGVSVATGGREVAAAGETMREIVEQIRRVSELVNEISGAASEQSRGIEQINQAITQMDQVTQQNAALVEEIAAAANSLEAQAQRPAESVASFKVA